MNKYFRYRHITALLTAASLLLPMAAFGGGTAVFNSGDKITHISWQDAHTVRIGDRQASHYMLIRDGKAYSVYKQGGHVRVMDLSNLFKGFAKHARKKQGRTSIAVVINDVQATGETVTIAGIQGRVYRVTVTKPNGETKIRRSVLTDNPLVIEMTRAYMGAMWQLLGIKTFKEFMGSLPEDYRGVLKIGDSMRLQAISSETPPASAFELPAEPQSLGQIMKQRMHSMGNH